MSFVLHKDLERDCFVIGDMPLCRVMLMNNSVYPWVILVPKRTQVSEVFDLPENDRVILMQEVADIAECLKTICAADKMNIAALGNITPQLHIHIIARFTHDPAWPYPIWGKDSQKYEDSSKKIMLEKLQSAFIKIQNFKAA